MAAVPNESAVASTSRLQALENNVKFLVKGGKAPASGISRRSLLQATRYILRFVFYRLIRYAKFAAVGAAVAFVGTGVLGTLTAGASWILLPTSLPAFEAGAALGIGTGVVKFGWRRFTKAHHGDWTGDARADERNDAEKVDTVYDKPNVFERAGMAGI